jgi:transposase-like protein
VILGLTAWIDPMPEHRGKFIAQFKAEAVQMVISTGKPIAQVARDLGIQDGTPGNGLNAAARRTGA